MTGCLIFAALGLGTVEATAATSSSLAGETFTSQNVSGSTLTGSCPGLNSFGLFDFSVSGTAAGPFPGTFTESGTINTTHSGFLTAFSSTFTITSTSGTVTGSKVLSGETNKVSCILVGGGPFLTPSDLATTYTATIDGTQRTAGAATVRIEGALGQRPAFSETFASTGEIQLTGKEQCRNGGWKSFRFKNHGDCVSFLATGGKNPPSES